MSGIVGSITDWLKGLLTEPPSSVLQLFILYLGAIISIAMATYRGLRMLFRRLWPPRPRERTWYAAATPLRQGESDLVDMSRNDANNAWRRDRVNWTHGREMRPGDAYTLRFDKARCVSVVRLHSEGLRYPKQCKFLVSYEHKRTEVCERPWEGDVIEFSFGKPRKIDGFEVIITEARKEPLGTYSGNPPAWSIYDIDVIEARLFGRWWKRQIV